MLLPPNATLRHTNQDELGRATAFHRIVVTWPDGDQRCTALKLTPGEALLTCAEILAGRRSAVEPWGDDLKKVGDQVDQICRATDPDDAFDRLTDMAMMGYAITTMADAQGRQLTPEEAEAALVRTRAVALQRQIADVRALHAVADALHHDSHAGSLRESPLWPLLLDVGATAAVKMRRWMADVGADQVQSVDGDDGADRALRRNPDMPNGSADAWVDRAVTRYMANPERHAEHTARWAARMEAENRPARKMTDDDVAEALEILGRWGGSRAGSLVITADADGHERFAPA